MLSIQKPFKLKFLRDQLIFVSSAVGILINIILWMMLLGKFGVSNEPIALHFNIVSGLDLVGATYRVYQLPLLGLIVWGVNFWLARVIYSWERLFSYFLVLGAALTQVVLFIAAFALVLLN